jgi:hypothetical protein
MTKDENERQYRLIDQLLTMQSALRDRYARRAFLLSSGLLGFSIFLNAFVFVDDKVFAAIGMRPELAKIGLGITSVMVLILSIIEFKADWAGKAKQHGEAAERLAALKAKFRQVHNATKGEDLKKNQSLGREFEKLRKTLPAVPERDFLKLKSKHVVKTLLSQRISDNPKSPMCFLLLQLRIEGIQRALKEGRSQPDREPK